MVRNLSSTLSYFLSHLHRVVGTILGHSGPGELDYLRWWPPLLSSCSSIFRADYGHIEVAAHFGNG